MKKPIIFFLLSVFFVGSIRGQNQHLIDSLNNELGKFNQEKLEMKFEDSSLRDTVAANILTQLSKIYLDFDFDKSKVYAEEVLAISEAIGFEKGKGNAYNLIGIFYDLKGDYYKSLGYYKKALAIRESIGDITGISKTCNNIGLIYLNLGRLPDALKMFFSSLKIKEELNDQNGIYTTYINIARIYYRQGNLEEAEKYYLATKNYSERTDDKVNVLFSYSGLGMVENKRKNYDSAIRYFKSVILISKEIGHKNMLVNGLENLGNAYGLKKEYSKALDYYFESLALSKELGGKTDISTIYGNIGTIYLKMKQLDVASKYIDSSFIIAKEISDLNLIQAVYGRYHDIEIARRNYKKALEYFEKHNSLGDSIAGKESVQKTAELKMQYDYEKEEAIAKAQQNRKDFVVEKERQRQKLIRNSFIGGFVFVLLFASVFLIQRNRIKREKNKSEKLLLNILPEQTAEELMKTGKAETRYFEQVTIMFTDFKNFTRLSGGISPVELVELINFCYSTFDQIISKYNIEKIKTIGDSYMCAAGLPVANQGHASEIISAALELRDFMLAEKKRREAEGKPFFEIRIGVNTGPVVAGIVGVKKFAYDIWGDAVNIASRMESAGEAGKVNISGSTFNLVKDTFSCSPRGNLEVKDLGSFEMYFVEPYRQVE